MSNFAAFLNIAGYRFKLKKTTVTILIPDLSGIQMVKAVQLVIAPLSNGFKPNGCHFVPNHVLVFE